MESIKTFSRVCVCFCNGDQFKHITYRSRPTPFFYKYMYVGLWMSESMYVCVYAYVCRYDNCAYVVCVSNVFILPVYSRSL